jgi:hypothetical protein
MLKFGVSEKNLTWLKSEKLDGGSFGYRRKDR